MGARMRYEDLTGPLKATVDALFAQPGRQGAPGLINTRVPDAKPASSLLAPETTRTTPGPNKTEAHFKAYHLRGLDARYEPLTFRMDNGLRYTPDWVVFEEGRPLHCYECKGSHKHHSQERSRLAFLQCAKEFPGLRWSWAVKTTDGWRIEHA